MRRIVMMALASLMLAIPVLAQTPFLGEIDLFAFGYAPKGYALCDGQLLSISQNTALFALLGTTFGGDGRTTFALPDLRGRRAISSGQGPGLNSYTLGQIGGEESVTILVNQLPAHTHSAQASTSLGTAAVPGVNSYWASQTQTFIYSSVSNAAMGGTVAMAPGTIGSAGGNSDSQTLPHENRAPFLVMNYSIALEGIFPSRD